MSQLQLFLLGTPEVKHHHQLLTFATRKAQALLFYLAVEGGRYSRQRLSEALWPDLDAHHGRAALRATLQQLRKLLDRTHLADERPHLNVEQGTISFEQDSEWFLDLQLIQSVSQQVRKIEQSQERMAPEAHQALLLRMEHATRLVRGPFLDGFSLRDSHFFDDWTRQQREYWHQRILRLFEALARFYEQVGDSEHALQTVDRWLVFDPLDEAGYRSLMHLRFSQGDRTGALRAFTTCRSILAQELQLQPEAETVALAKHIRLTTPRRLPQPAPCSWMQPPSTLLETPLVGRGSQFRTFIAWYQRMRTGQTHILLLEGEAGVGKTRLASELLNWAQAQGAEVLEGRCLQTEEELPYQALIDALRPRMAQEPAPNQVLGDVWLAELSRVLPELRERAPGLPACTPDPVVGHHLLLEATARLLRAWAAKHPLILFLDDVQWATRATRDLLLYLAQSFAKQRAPILLLLSVRTGSLNRWWQTTCWLAALKQIGLPETTLTLAALPQEDVRTFVQALPWGEQHAEVTDTSCPRGKGPLTPSSCFLETLEGFAEWLFTRTHGHPFYLVETLKECLTRGLLLPSQGHDGRWELALGSWLLEHHREETWIASTVREQICQQVQQLSASASRLLGVAAIVEHDLTFERLCRVAEMEEQEGLPALEELVGNGFLLEGRSAEGWLGQLTFAQELVREVVSQEAGATRQRLVQRRAQSILEVKEGPVPARGHSAPQPNRDLSRELKGIDTWQEWSKPRVGPLARVLSPLGPQKSGWSARFTSQCASQGGRVRRARPMHGHPSVAKPRPPPTW